MNTRRITTPSTAAIVTLVEPRFENAAGAEDANFITMYMQVKLNGLAGEFGDSVTFARNATQLEKQTAVRTKINNILTTFEPGVTLNNANIQIIGLPI